MILTSSISVFIVQDQLRSRFGAAPAEKDGIFVLFTARPVGPDPILRVSMFKPSGKRLLQLASNARLRVALIILERLSKKISRGRGSELETNLLRLYPWGI